MENISQNKVEQTNKEKMPDAASGRFTPKTHDKLDPRKTAFRNYFILLGHGFDQAAIANMIRFCKHFALPVSLVLKFPKLVEQIKKAPPVENINGFVSKHPKMVEVLNSDPKFLDCFNGLLPELGELDEQMKQKGRFAGPLPNNPEIDHNVADMGPGKAPLNGLHERLRTSADSPDTLAKFIRKIHEVYKMHNKLEPSITPGNSNDNVP